MMPRMDGWETCRRIRELSSVPIVMLTAKSALPDELKGLNIGADLYITKPFVIEVLIARVEALLRRSRLTADQPRRQTIVCGELTIDEAKHEVTLGDQIIDLSPTEFKLLAALAHRVGEVVTHRELLAQVWGPEYVDEDLYLKLYIRYLRQKIEADPSKPSYILTRRGVGYWLEDDKGRAVIGE
jgi:two-component system KDP operon response regulator KdpE